VVQTFLPRFIYPGAFPRGISTGGEFPLAWGLLSRSFANKYLYNYNNIIMNRIKRFGEYLVEAVALDQLATQLGGTTEPVEEVTDWSAVRGYLDINRVKLKETLVKATGDKMTAMVVLKVVDIYAEDKRDGVTPDPDWLGGSPIVDDATPDLQEMVKVVVAAIQRNLAKSDAATLAKLTATGKGIKTSRY
jgi:hypothetical protein